MTIRSGENGALVMRDEIRMTQPGGTRIPELTGRIAGSRRNGGAAVGDLASREEALAGLR